MTDWIADADGYADGWFGDGGLEHARKLREAERAAVAAPGVAKKKLVVDHPRLYCPGCGKVDFKQTGCEWPVRQFRCRAPGCGVAFQTIDRGPRPPRKSG